MQAVPCGRRRPSPRISPFSGPVRACGGFSARAWVFGRFRRFDDPENRVTAQKTAPCRSCHKSGEPCPVQRVSPPPRSAGQDRAMSQAVPCGRHRHGSRHPFQAGFHVSWFVPVSAGHSVSTPEWCKTCQYDLRHIPDLGFCENTALEQKTNHQPSILRFRRPVFDTCSTTPANPLPPYLTEHPTMCITTTRRRHSHRVNHADATCVRPHSMS